MKKTFLLLFLSIPLLVFSGCNQRQQGEEHLGASYYKKPDGVYYGEDKLKNADKETFKLLNDPIWSEYATDKNRAYGFGKELKNVDLNSFNVLSFRYAKDKTNVFCFGDKLEKADPESFENSEKWDTYSKDKNSVYFNCNIIDIAEPQSFTVYFGGEGIAKDKNNVFCGQEKLKGADASTFSQVIPPNPEERGAHFEYTKDKSNVYYRCNYIVKNADSETFEVIDFNFAKDKNHIFKDGAILEGFNPKTFKSEDVEFDSMGEVIKK